MKLGSLRATELRSIKTLSKLQLIGYIRSISVDLRGIKVHWDKILPIWNILEKSTEVLTKRTQYLRLESEYLWKKKNWPHTQDIKSYWEKLYSNKSSWNSREEAETRIIQRKQDGIIKPRINFNWLGSKIYLNRPTSK